jgi:DNA-binding transcriptional regulator/RsmH inhibitor MraZ
MLYNISSSKMKKIIMPTEKRDVQKLSGDELVILAKFGGSKELEVLSKLAEWSKTRRAFEALDSNNLDSIKVLSGINIGGDKEEFDNDTELK